MIAVTGLRRGRARWLSLRTRAASTTKHRIGQRTTKRTLEEHRRHRWYRDDIALCDLL